MWYMPWTPRASGGFALQSQTESDWIRLDPTNPVPDWRETGASYASSPGM